MKKINGLGGSVFSLLWAGRLCCGAEAPGEVREVSFTAECDGTTQRYVIIFPERRQTAKPLDALIALHGHGSDRWQFVRDGRDECRAARDFAAARGMLYVSPDYRAPTSWMGPKAEADVVQIIANLKKEFGAARVFICGASMGGAAALAFAAMHPELVAGVAAMNGTANFLEYENFQDAIRASFGGDKRQIPLEYKKRSAEYWPERLTMPIAMTACGKDTAVPPQSVMRLAGVLKAMGGKALLIYREELGHLTTYADAMAALEFMAEGEASAAAAEQ